MVEQNNNAHTDEQLPEAVVQERSRFSIVWLIPLVAAAIGGWLAYKAFSEQGPTITISFKSADGLEAGKTKVKYKDVEVGQVEAIDLSQDLSHVVVTAKLVKGAETYLTENTRFWVVTARVAAGQVSGLGTIFGGAYIAVDPVTHGKSTRAFKGLDVPPVVTTGEPGHQFDLRGEELGSLQVGSPVYYRAFKVGQVVAYRLDKDGKGVDVKVFVDAPYDELVRQSTRFWNVSGLDVSLNASGITVDTASVVSLLIGGVAFDTPPSLESTAPVKEGQVFRLYPNRRSVHEKTYTRKVYWLLNFTGSVRGLAVGAPVEFRGIKLGQVTDIKLQVDIDDAKVRIPVLVEIEPDRVEKIGKMPTFKSAEEEERARRELWDRLVAQGLRAQLKTGNLLTGALFVDLDMHPEAPPQTIHWAGQYPELPTVPTPLEEIGRSLTRLVDRLARLPLEQVGDELQKSLGTLRQTLVQLEQLAGRLNTSVAPEINATLTQTQKTLVAAEQLLAPSSGLQQEAQRVLTELAAAARSIRVMADYLERHPEALIQGKRGSAR